MPKRILVVDDERHVTRLIEVNLQRAGYKVTCAYDGEHALDEIAQEKPDLVITDIMMPFINGLQLIATIRSNPALSSIPIVVLTARAQDKDIFEGYRLGADVYLTKPFNPIEVLFHVSLSFSEIESSKKYDL